MTDERKAEIYSTIQSLNSQEEKQRYVDSLNLSKAESMEMVQYSMAEYKKKDMEQNPYYNLDAKRFYNSKGQMGFRAQSPRARVPLKGKRLFKGVYALNYYGSKRSWSKEFLALYEFAKSKGHTEFIDCFGGSGYLSLLASSSGLFEYIQLNDLGYLNVNLFHVMKDDVEFRKFMYSLFLKPNDLDRLKEIAKEITSIQDSGRKQYKKPDPILAAKYYASQYYQFHGSGGIAKRPLIPQEYERELEATHNLLKAIDISQYHYKKVMLSHLENPHSLIMMDCPYLPEVRTKPEAYAFEMSRRQHRYMLEELTKCVYPSMVVVCGYENDLYDNYFMRFNQKHDFRYWHCLKLLRAGRRGTEAKERLWINFNPHYLIWKYQKFFELIY